MFFEARCNIKHPFLLHHNLIIGHVEDELNYKVCEAFESLQLVMKDYMESYNYNLFQWTLQKMAPIEYQNHLLSA